MINEVQFITFNTASKWILFISDQIKHSSNNLDAYLKQFCDKINEGYFAKDEIDMVLSLTTNPALSQTINDAILQHCGPECTGQICDVDDAI